MTGNNSVRATGHVNGDSGRKTPVTHRGLIDRLDKMLENSRSSSRSRHILSQLHAA